MTAAPDIPDWLVERVALDEVDPAMRDRVDRADVSQLADRVAKLRADNAAELAAYPAGPAVAQIEARVAAARQQRPVRRRRLVALAGAASVTMIAVVAGVATRGDQPARSELVASAEPPEVTRIKGAARLLVYRNGGDHPQQLAEDDVARPGDVLQLRYNAGGERHGLIASIDGARTVTLHFPTTPRASTELAAKPTALPDAYALDEAPRFERFFFITSASPIDVTHTLGALDELAARDDSATAPATLPPNLHQWSIRLRKPEATKP